MNPDQVLTAKLNAVAQKYNMKNTELDEKLSKSFLKYFTKTQMFGNYQLIYKVLDGLLKLK